MKIKDLEKRASTHKKVKFTQKLLKPLDFLRNTADWLTGNQPVSRSPKPTRWSKMSNKRKANTALRIRRMLRR